MIYSCFDQERGVYRVFEDDGHRAVNGDLPVPRLPADAGRVGVASIEAGRALPRSAQYVGDSWNAKGIVTSCTRRGTLGTTEGSVVDGATQMQKMAVLGGLLLLAGVLVYRSSSKG